MTKLAKIYLQDIRNITPKVRKLSMNTKVQNLRKESAEILYPKMKKLYLKEMILPPETFVYYSPDLDTDPDFNESVYLSKIDVIDTANPSIELATKNIEQLWKRTLLRMMEAFKYSINPDEYILTSKEIKIYGSISSRKRFQEVVSSLEGVNKRIKNGFHNAQLGVILFAYNYFNLWD